MGKNVTKNSPEKDQKAAEPSSVEFAARIEQLDLAAVGLVMLFFLAFMVLLGLSFPQGTSLKELMLQPGQAEDRRVPTGIELELGDEPQPFIATLSDARRTVKDRRSSGIVWNQSQAADHRPYFYGQ